MRCHDLICFLSLCRISPILRAGSELAESRCPVRSKSTTPNGDTQFTVPFVIGGDLAALVAYVVVREMGHSYSSRIKDDAL